MSGTVIALQTKVSKTAGSIDQWWTVVAGVEPCSPGGGQAQPRVVIDVLGVDLVGLYDSTANNIDHEPATDISTPDGDHYVFNVGQFRISYF